MFSLSLEIQKAKAATSQGPPGMTQVPAPRQKETENEVTETHREKSGI